MNETVSLLLALAAGVMLGGFFFGGLLWTVRHGLSARQPALWFLVSLLVRTLTVLAGFYYVSAGHWQRMLLCLLGFFIARLMVTRLSGRTATADDPPLTQHLHAAHAERSSISDSLKGNSK
ncbi:N-ATPase subunit AtpR [Rhodocyclaceae bacterium SMB388]